MEGVVLVRSCTAGAGPEGLGRHDENVEAAQRAYYHRAKMNSAAHTGMYAPEMEKEAVTGLRPNELDVGRTTSQVRTRSVHDARLPGT